MIEEIFLLSTISLQISIGLEFNIFYIYIYITVNEIFNKNDGEDFKVYRQCACYCCDSLPPGFNKNADSHSPLFDLNALKDQASLWQGTVLSWSTTYRYCVNPQCLHKNDLQHAWYEIRDLYSDKSY